MRHPRAWFNINHVPGRHSGSLPAALWDRGLGPTAENAKAERCRVARREDAGASADAPGSRRSGPAREKRAGLAKSRPCAFSARHSPHLGKGKRDGQPPSPTKPGVSIALAMRYLPTREDLMRRRARNIDRHPEARAKRASKGDGRGLAAHRGRILRGPLRGLLRMTG